jgi:hypothetical protein
LPLAPSFEIKRPLETGGERWAQTYVAQASGQQEVVLKIYQESLFPWPIFYEGEVFVNGWKSSWQVGAHEEAVYDYLKPLQGSDIPYCYGRYIVSLWDWLLP